MKKLLFSSNTNIFARSNIVDFALKLLRSFNAEIIHIIFFTPNVINVNNKFSTIARNERKGPLQSLVENWNDCNWSWNTILKFKTENLFSQNQRSTANLNGKWIVEWVCTLKRIFELYFTSQINFANKKY